MLIMVTLTTYTVPNCIMANSDFGVFPGKEGRQVLQEVKFLNVTFETTADIFTRT